MDFSGLNTYKRTNNVKNFDRLTPQLPFGQQLADPSNQTLFFLPKKQNPCVQYPRIYILHMVLRKFIPKNWNPQAQLPISDKHHAKICCKMTYNVTVGYQQANQSGQKIFFNPKNEILVPNHLKLIFYMFQFMLVFPVHVSISSSCQYLQFMLVFPVHVSISSSCQYFQFMLVFPVHVSISSSCQYLERETPCELAPALQ